MPKLSQKGTVPLLVLMAVIGIVGFLAVSSIAPLRNQLLSTLFPKPPSYAAECTTSLQTKIDSAASGSTVTADPCIYRQTITINKPLTLDGKGDKKKIEGRIGQIRRELEASDSEFDKEKLQERLAKLTGGVAVINVGAATEVEMKEKKERVIDAVAATKAAIEEGIVPGGEVSLLRVAKALDKVKGGNSEEQLGVILVQKALEKPFEKLMENAGLNPGLMMAEVMKASLNFGVDVNDGVVKDLVKAGVIDPVKVARTALQNAASVAIMTMTTNVLIADKPEPPAPPAPPGGGMPGMGEY